MGRRNFKRGERMVIVNQAFRIACVLATVAFAGDAFGQHCDSYVGMNIAPQTFDAAIQGVAGISPKGEFETTAQYESRKAAAGGGAATLIISKEPEDRKYFEYDADNQRLAIKSYAFDNVGFDAWSALYSAGYYNKIKAGTSGNLDIVVSRTERPVGTYEASNSYGANTTVQKIERTTQAIFQGESPSVMASLFPQAERSPYEVGSLSLSPAEAQQLKPQLQIAFVVVPMEPYVIRGTHSVGETTIRNPNDVTENFTMLIADFKCGLILDGDNKVLGSYPTR